MKLSIRLSSCVGHKTAHKGAQKAVHEGAYTAPLRAHKAVQEEAYKAALTASKAALVAATGSIAVLRVLHE